MKLDESIKGGELFQTIVYNPVSYLKINLIEISYISIYPCMAFDDPFYNIAD